jgi:hypothetical protein
LTCCRRTAEVILARWGEIDFSTGPFGDVWHVPGSRVKTGNRHGRTVDGAFIPFDGHMQHDGMAILLRELGVPSTVHVTRAMFRSWVSDHAQSVQDHDAAEICLDHAIGSRVQRSYDRSDMLIQRRDLAERWAQFLMG